MNGDSDYALAQHVANALSGKFWQVTVGDWWVVVEGISSQKLVILTNDPFGAAFTPRELSIGLKELKRKVITELQHSGIVSEDGSWSIAMAS